MTSALIRFGLWAAVAGTSLLLLAGFAGALHPAGDALAVVRLPLAAFAVGLALLAGMGGERRAAVVALLAASLAAPAALSYHAGAAAGIGAHGAIYQKNMWFRLDDVSAVVEDIRASGADIVTLQEVGERNRAILALLAEDYPTQAFCRFGRIGGTVVLSRWPPDGEPVCPRAGGMTAMRLVSPEGPVWAISLHLHWPWPFRQDAHVAALVSQIEALEGPVVIGGDFNMVPWGASVAAIERAARARKAGPTATTLAMRFDWVPALLPIDHVLLPEGWHGRQDIRPELGSDHRGVVVRFAR